MIDSDRCRSWPVPSQPCWCWRSAPFRSPPTGARSRARRLTQARRLPQAPRAIMRARLAPVSVKGRQGAATTTRATSPLPPVRPPRLAPRRLSVPQLLSSPLRRPRSTPRPAAPVRRRLRRHLRCLSPSHPPSASENAATSDCASRIAMPRRAWRMTLVALVVHDCAICRAVSTCMPCVSEGECLHG